MFFHNVQKNSAVIQIHAGTHSASRVADREYNARSPPNRLPLREHESQAGLDHGSHGLFTQCRFLFYLAQQSFIETNRRSHMSRHIVAR